MLDTAYLLGKRYSLGGMASLLTLAGDEMKATPTPARSISTAVKHSIFSNQGKFQK
jgi:hypothetical protein